MELDKRITALKKFYHQYRRLPSYAEMLGLFKLRSKNSIFKLVKHWQKEGLIIKSKRHLSPAPKFFSLPLLGFVKAGYPAPAVEEIDQFNLDTWLLVKPDVSFILKVSGDSLMNMGILENDYVILEKSHQAKNNNLVLALIDGQWTLKIFKKNQGKIQLVSANPKYPPFIPKEELKIYGVVKSVIRKMA